MYAELGQMKACVRCKETKALDQFRFRKNKGGARKPHYESWCLFCERESNKHRYYELGFKQIQKARDFDRNCKKFGMTAEAYNQMAIDQGFRCAICKQTETSMRAGVIKNLAIDHCHTTGRIRGLLCHACNTSIGLMKEDASRFAAATEYLQKSKN